MQELWEVPRFGYRRTKFFLERRGLPMSGIWAFDFVFVACGNGQQLKCRTVIDQYTRECLTIDIADGTKSSRVIEVFSRLISVHGAPKAQRSDH